jgi:hypothetical protein
MINVEEFWDWHLKTLRRGELDCGEVDTRHLDFYHNISRRLLRM